MKLWFYIGTAGELIKVYPLFLEADRQGVEWVCLHSGQSGRNFWRQWEDFGLPKEKVRKLISSENDLSSAAQALSWFSMGSLNSWFLSNIILHEISPEADVLLVHGDTLSTLQGALAGWLNGVSVAHIEAGLRSERLFQPFPEEINRRLTSRLSKFHFAPDQVAAKNLKDSGFEKNVFNTEANTMVDAVREVLSKEVSSVNSPYAVANLHRHENLNHELRWQSLVDTLLKAAKKMPVHLALHAPTKAKLDSLPIVKAQLEAAGVVLHERMKFSRFLTLLAGAEFVLSDGGSNQEECYYLGLPCLVMRNTTERVEGLGKNAILSKFSNDIINEFLENFSNYRRDSVFELVHPSKRIIEVLKQRVGS